MNVKSEQNNRNEGPKTINRVTKKPIWKNYYITDFREVNGEVLFVLMREHVEKVPHSFEEIDALEDQKLWNKSRSGRDASSRRKWYIG